MRRFVRGVIERLLTAGSNQGLDGLLTAFQPKDRPTVVRR